MSAYTTQIQKLKILALFTMLFLLSALAMLTIKETTRFGAGLRPDSFSYLSAAENIVQGGGYGRPTWNGGFKPVTGFPPIFSLAVAVIHRTGLPAYPSARVLNGLLFGLTSLLAGFAIYLASRSVGFSLFGAVIILISSVLMDIFSWAHSEPLYLFLSLLGIVLLSIFLADPKQRIYFWLSALMISAAFLTRYAGSALVAAGFAGLLLAYPLDLRTRLRDGVSYLLITLLPMGVFLVRNHFLTGNFTNRPAPFWHPPDVERWFEAAKTTLTWILPESFTSSLSNPISIIMLAFLILGLVLVYVFSKARVDQERTNQQFRNRLILLIFIYLLFNVLLIFATVYFLDVLTPLDNRILVPLHISALLLVVLLLSSWWDAASNPIKVIIAIISVALVITQANQAYLTFSRLRAEPQGYASSIYRNSKTIAFVRELPEVPIFTNDLPALYFWANRIGVFIPNEFNPSSKEAIDPGDYEQLLKSLRRILRDNDGYLVIIGSNPRERLPSKQFEEVTRGMKLIEEFNDGLIYTYK